MMAFHYPKRSKTMEFSANQIREHMEVIGSDGEHVGKVDHVQGQQIKLAAMDLSAGFKHHMIELSLVQEVVNEKVRLSIPAKQAKQQWKEAA
jgi:hypothetical protein